MKLKKSEIFDNKPVFFPDIDTGIKEDTAIPLGSGYITSLLGKGGMANVYEIWNKDLEVYRAVKLMHPTCTENEKERFDTEVKISAKLHHQYITEIHGVGKWNGLSYLEMEKIDGITLKELIRERGALSVTACTAIGIMICEAIHYAHNQEYVLYGKKYKGLIHRDLKPSNIMLCKNGIIKIMDFGIARPLDASFHTIAGGVVGTIQYLPPEQLKGECIDVRTDIYAAAATLYEILTGTMAFPESNLPKLIQEKVKNHYKPLHDYTITMPRELRKIIHQCMHYDPARRVPSALILLHKLTMIHSSITADSPQQVLKKLLTARVNEKIVVSEKKINIRSLTPQIVILSLIGITLGLFLHFYELFEKRNDSLLETKVHAEISPKITEKKDSDPLKHYRDLLAVIEKQEHVNNAAKANQRPKPDSRSMIVKKAPAPIISAIKTDVQDKDNTISFVEKMKKTYRTDNLEDALEKAFYQHKYQEAIAIYKEIQKRKTTNKKVQMYYLRTLEKTGAQQALQDFLFSETIDDGEFYLAKAKMLLDQKKITETLSCLDHSLRSPSELMDNTAIKQEAYYYRSLCETVKFDNNPSEETYKNALDTWYQLKTILKTKQDHQYYKTAVAQMQRIGEKYRNHRK